MAVAELNIGNQDTHASLVLGAMCIFMVAAATPFPWGNAVIAIKIIAARWFGTFEGYAAFAAGVYGVLLLIDPEAAHASTAVSEVADYFGRWLAVPFLLKAALTGAGLTMPALQIHNSDWLRCVGAVIGTFLWLWLALQFWSAGAIGSVGFALAGTATLFSVRVIGATIPDRRKPRDV